MTIEVRPLLFKPHMLKGLSHRLLISHYENNYGGALRRLNAIDARLRAFDWAAAPRLPEMKNPGGIADGGVGVLNGVLGGSTGLAGVWPMMWSGLRGWTRDEQRAGFQPTGVATFLMSILVFGGVGLVTPDTIKLFLIGLPVLIVDTLLGWACYGQLNEASFRKIVLSLLLVSG